jgi:hypothetical protein
MWGNDPAVTGNDFTNPQPTVTRINPQLKETSINANTQELPPTHLGWNGRLNGPVDNPLSSCMSCHMTAEVPALSPMNPTFQADAPPIGSTAWMRWFQNAACGQPFDPQAQSADFSLQLALGVVNFEQWKAPAQGGLFASDYGAPTAATAATAKPSLGAPAAKPGTHPIVRDLKPAPRR